MNSWVLPSHLIDNMIVSQSADATYFVFDRDLALSQRSVKLLVRGVFATAKALGVEDDVDIPVDDLVWVAGNSDKPKMVLKHYRTPKGPKTVFFERD